MIREFTDKFVASEATVKAQLAKEHPGSYEDIVRLVVETINPDQDYGLPDVERIYRIDDGDYQGTLVFVIGAIGYQPYDYWYVRVSYGSCSGCDTLQDIHDYSYGPPTPEQVQGYWTLALHVAQGLKAMGDD